MDVYGRPGQWSWITWIKNHVYNGMLYACLFYLISCLGAVVYMVQHR